MSDVMVGVCCFGDCVDVAISAECFKYLIANKVLILAYRQ